METEPDAAEVDSVRDENEAAEVDSVRDENEAAEAIHDFQSEVRDDLKRIAKRSRRIKKLTVELSKTVLRTDLRNRLDRLEMCLELGFVVACVCISWLVWNWLLL